MSPYSGEPQRNGKATPAPAVVARATTAARRPGRAATNMAAMTHSSPAMTASTWSRLASGCGPPFGKIPATTAPQP
jgi:hypothetical protein